LRPELVDMQRRGPGKDPWIGMVKDERPPSRALGEKIVQSQVARLSEVQQELLSSYEPREGWRAPSQTDIAALWTRFETTTRRYWVTDLTLAEFHDKSRCPEFPGWEALGE
jgi:hypothetical protein